MTPFERRIISGFHSEHHVFGGETSWTSEDDARQMNESNLIDYKVTGQKAALSLTAAGKAEWRAMRQPPPQRKSIDPEELTDWKAKRDEIRRVHGV